MDEQRRRQMEEENYRLEREAEERERQRRLEEHRDIQKKVAKERIEQLKSTTLGARALATYSEEVRLLTLLTSAPVGRGTVFNAICVYVSITTRKGMGG